VVFDLALVELLSDHYLYVHDPWHWAFFEPFLEGLDITQQNARRGERVWARQHERNVIAEVRKQ
jgi:hypothetical protein